MNLNQDYILEKWLKNNIAILKSRYVSWGVKASGEYESSLRYEITKNGAVIIGADYSVYTEHGRNAGKFPHPNSIIQWIKDKGIQSNIKIESLAYLIGRKIAKSGVKPSSERYAQSSNLFESVFNKKSIDELNSMLLIDGAKQVNNEMNNYLKNKFKTK